MRRERSVHIFVLLAILAILGLAATASGQAREAIGAPVPSPSIESAGGPDGYGYTYIDSAEPGGPTYTWADITTTGTAITGWAPDSDDGSAGPFPIGFSFPFYGVAQTQFYAGTNGFLSFGAGSTSLSNQCPLPSATTPNDLIAMLWDDLDFRTSGNAYYQTFAACPVGTGACTVIEYAGVMHYGGAVGSAGTWETVLYPDGKILLQFQDPGAETGSSSTTGIEGPGGTYGLHYGACDIAGSLTANLAVLYQLSGFTLTTPDTTLSGVRGATVTYPMTITNNTGGAVTYNMTYTGFVWPTAGPATVGPVGSGSSANFNVTVQIPWTIGQCQTDGATVTATDPAVPATPHSLNITTSGPTASVLYDNGPLVTHPGGGSGGADASTVRNCVGYDSLRLWQPGVRGQPARRRLRRAGRRDLEPGPGGVLPVPDRVDHRHQHVHRDQLPDLERRAQRGRRGYLGRYHHEPYDLLGVEQHLPGTRHRDDRHDPTDHGERVQRGGGADCRDLLDRLAGQRIARLGPLAAADLHPHADIDRQRVAVHAVGLGRRGGRHVHSGPPVPLRVVRRGRRLGRRPGRLLSDPRFPERCPAPRPVTHSPERHPRRPDRRRR